MRTKYGESESTNAGVTLDELIPIYASNKVEFDSYKKICDSQNAAIKQMMTEFDEDTHVSGDYTAKKIVSTRETINEDKMFEILKSAWVNENGSMQCPYIKTKEYIDTDELEKAIYNGDIDDETLRKLDTCREIKEVVTLKVTKKKEKKS